MRLGLSATGAEFIGSESRLTDHTFHQLFRESLSHRHVHRDNGAWPFAVGRAFIVGVRANLPFKSKAEALQICYNLAGLQSWEFVPHLIAMLQPVTPHFIRTCDGFRVGTKGKNTLEKSL